LGSEQAAVTGRTALELRQCGQHFFAVVRGLYIEPDFFDVSLRIDQKSVTSGKLCDAHVHHRIVLRRNIALCVGKQLEAQAFFRAELLVRIFVLHADADDHSVLRFILR
jgi:hypothetical protein